MQSGLRFPEVCVVVPDFEFRFNLDLLQDFSCVPLRAGLGSPVSRLSDFHSVLVTRGDISNCRGDSH